MAFILCLLALLICSSEFTYQMSNAEERTLLTLIRNRKASVSATSVKCRKYLIYRLCMLPSSTRIKAINCMGNGTLAASTYKIGQAIQWCVHHHIDYHDTEKINEGPFNSHIGEAVDKLCSKTQVEVRKKTNYMRAIGPEASLVMDCVFIKAVIPDDRYVVMQLVPKCLQDT
ncbi:uncharacterized protein LOC143253470 [Tachypleus tridentatus]|uniref:uncharacterized protein LOC143253470 n=1 Tax=Tachypleus tridentatus TaxID=6853 RepID=UPI003FD165FD